MITHAQAVGNCTLHGRKHPLPSRRPTFVVVDSNHRAVLPLAISESTFSSTLALEGV